MEDRPIRLFDPGALHGGRLDALVERFSEFVRDGVYIDGPWVARFEAAVARRLGFKHAIGTANGTSALILALKAAGVGSGDDVVTVANTYYATVRAIREVGARPVFADVDPRNAQMDPARAEDSITPRTRAILAVHLYGWPAQSAVLLELSRRRGLRLIEDCAHAFGGGPNGRAFGSLADFGCYSFYPTKPLGAMGDAGLAATNDDEAAGRIRRLRYFADDARTSFDPLTFDPDAIHAKLDALHAALGLIALEGIDAEKIARLARVTRYRERLAPIRDRLLDLPDPDACPYVFPLRVLERDRFVAVMQSAGIQVGVHYATDLHRLDEFGAAPRGSLPETERLNAEIVSLPVHPGISLGDVDRVCRQVLAFLEDPGH